MFTEHATSLIPHAGACDTHMHIYDPAFPHLAKTDADLPKGNIEDYKALQRMLGLERVVVVQPSVYGTDNTCLVSAVKSFGTDVARGIAVVGANTPDAEIAKLSRNMIVGARFHMLPGGVIGWDQLDKIAARVAEHGWHVQLQLDGCSLSEKVQQIERWPGRIVIDHIGKFMKPITEDHPSFICLLRLLETGRVWVKLSAPYEVSMEGPPHYEDIGKLAKSLVRAAPERMLWASNWPHPTAKDNPPDDLELLNLLEDWAGDTVKRNQILVDNANDLYEFSRSVS